MYSITKKFDGFSCVFRQWRADSHCKYLHGYDPSITVKLNCNTLNDKKWVYDFAGFKQFKKWLADLLDHTVIVAQDDPQITLFKDLCTKNLLIQLRIVEHIGAESFAKLIYEELQSNFLKDFDGVIEYVEFAEHEKNSARYYG